MIRYLLNRLIAGIPVLIGVMVVVFLMLHLVPGDPVLLILGEGTAVTPEVMNEMRERLGLNAPLPVQFLRFAGNALQGDWGRSIRFNEPVTSLVAQNLVPTLQLAAFAAVIAAAVGIPLGVLAASRRNTWVDTTSMLVALFGVSVPSFWLGQILIFVFAYRLAWLPITGQGGIERLILPAVTLSVLPMAMIARILRSSMLEVMGQAYMDTARAKGLTETGVIYRHGLKNAMIPVLTLMGLELGRLLGGAFIVETVFGRIGLGRLAINGILNKDFPVVQGITFLIAVIYLGINIAVDICYAFLDPRVRYS